MTVALVGLGVILALVGFGTGAVIAGVLALVFEAALLYRLGSDAR